MSNIYEDSRYEIYTKEFYSGPNRRSYDSARIILPEIIEMFSPMSVVDYGCGRGTWLTAALELGVEVAVGYEGPWVTQEMLMHPDIELHTQDAEKGVHIEGQFDLAICLEVVEHLKSVEELCSASKTVLFSGAIPYQGGNGHINERPQSYWVRLFQGYGCKCLDIVRPKHWENEAVGADYKQNCFIFTRDVKVYEDFVNSRAFNRNGLPYDLVHPWFFEFHQRQMNQGNIELMKRSVKGIVRSLLKKLPV